MLIDRACYERGCACFDPRIDKDPVLVPNAEWQTVGTDAEILELSKDAWGRNKLKHGATDHTKFYIDFARLIEAKLKEKNA